MELWEVILEDEEGTATVWGPDEAEDEAHAIELAREKYPHLHLVDAMLVDP